MLGWKLMAIPLYDVRTCNFLTWLENIPSLIWEVQNLISFKLIHLCNGKIVVASFPHPFSNKSTLCGIALKYSFQNW